ncbi:MAG: RNA-binding protein [Chitinophagaceae bacterium]|nr:RNA-binding protein [Chitinophagaceae bacterium]
MFKKITELQFGFRDAENYRSREFKTLFNEIFVRTEELDKLCNSNIYFLMGEKGTGKTAFSMYLTNNDYKNTLSRTSFIRETEYEKFVILKREKHLTLSDYTSIWRVILALLMSKKIAEQEKDVLLNPLYTKFKEVNNAVDEYYASAFSPEISYALQFVEKSKLAAEIVAKYAKLQAGESTEVSFSESRFQINLLYIKRQFENALNSIKLSKNHLLFIDGIDIRPGHIPYEDYLECIKGLANAVWEINNDFFSSIKDSPGRMRVVLLMRPDIYATLGLQNMNNKFRDNSVLLDWRTTYPEYRTSPIFEVVDTLLSSQQSLATLPGKSWDHYFPYRIRYEREGKWEDHSFIGFLRNSLFRPRDIIAMLQLLQEDFKRSGRNPIDVFEHSDFTNPEFVRKYADFRLGEIKDHLSFYYNEKDYDLFLRFFTFLNGKFQFNYEDFEEVFGKFTAFIEKNKFQKPIFCETADTFLQFLYESNVICYIEFTDDEPFFRWCYRERDYSNIAPKVKIGETYRIHYGLSKSLNVGKEIKLKSQPLSTKTKLPNNVRDIYVQNIDYECQPNELAGLFSQFGRVVKVTIPRDFNNERARGFAFIRMSSQNESDNAVRMLDNTTFQNRLIKLGWSK